LVTNFPVPNLSQHPPLQIPNANNEMNIAVDQGGGEEVPVPPLGATHPNDLIRRFPSGHDAAPPIPGIFEEHKVCENISENKRFIFYFYL